MGKLAASREILTDIVRFTPGIFVMEASIIFVPCWQIYRKSKLLPETREAIAEWQEKKLRTNGSLDSVSGVTPSSVGSQNSRRSEMYSMNALEMAIKSNPMPLLLFSALKDFSGENISFLSHIRDWKAAWNPQVARKHTGQRLEGGALRRHLFGLAVEIYCAFVSMRYSDFPVNLSSVDQKELEAMFDSAASAIAEPVGNSATPFGGFGKNADVESSATELITFDSVDSSMEDALGRSSHRLSTIKNLNLYDLRPRLRADFEVPDTFSPEVFDKVEMSIKYMVLTNTWPKFVAAGYANVGLTQPSRFGGSRFVFFGFLKKSGAQIEETVRKYPKL